LSERPPLRQLSVYSSRGEWATWKVCIYHFSYIYHSCLSAVVRHWTLKA